MATLAILVVTALLAPLAAAAPKRAVVGSSARPSLEGRLPDAVPGEVVVKFRKGVARGVQRRAVSSLGATVVAGPVKGLSVVRTTWGRTTEELIDSLSSSPSVAYAEPNLLRYLSFIPDDPRFSDQWGLDNTGQAHSISGSASTKAGNADADMDVAEAWDVQQGNADTVVAIMDSGVDVLHPDLADNIWVNEDEIPGNGIDDDANGYIDDVNGWDFADDDATLLEPDGEFIGWDHGTHVAGIVGAVANNGIGVAGVCPSCKLMVLKMFEPFDLDGDGIDDTMVGDLAAELKAFDYASRMGADVINGSFGGALFASRAERARIKAGIAAGITMVFAAGNENGDNDLLIPGLYFDDDDIPDMLSPAYPASYDLPGIISVAASNDADQNGFQSACYLAEGSEEWPCAFTNWGRDSVDVSAPGVDVVSTLPNDSYETFDGTSMAAPNVAGVAGLVKAHHPEYSPRQVANAIMDSVDKPVSLQSFFGIPGLGPFRAELTKTAGRVNAAEALALAPPTGDISPRSDGTIAGAKRLRRRAFNSVSWPGDVNDVYKKRLVRGARYRVTLDTVGENDLDLQIYRPKTKDIWQFDGRCFSAGACPVLYYAPTSSGDVVVRARRCRPRPCFRAPKDGVYYFHVNAWLLETGSYRLKVIKL